MRKIPILTYHSVDESGSVISVSRNTFKKQMLFFARRGYTSLSISQLLSAFNGNNNLPKKSFVITFDDGYENVYAQAFPVLAEYGFTASIYLIANYCGKFNDWPGHVIPNGRHPLMDWREVREMHSYGFEFGAHSLSHPDLRVLTHDQAEIEIVQSKSIVEDQLSQAVHSFAYPYGYHTPEIRAIVSKYFESAVTTRLGRVNAGADPHALNRLDMYYFRRARAVMSMENPLFDGIIYGRQLIRDLKGD